MCRQRSVTERWVWVRTERRGSDSQPSLHSGFQCFWRVLSVPTRFNQYDIQRHHRFTTTNRRGSAVQGRFDSDFRLGQRDGTRPIGRLRDAPAQPAGSAPIRPSQGGLSDQLPRLGLRRQEGWATMRVSAAGYEGPESFWWTGVF